MPHTTAMSYLRLVNGEWELAGTIEKRNSADDFPLLGSHHLGSKRSPMEKKIACLGQALEINDLENFKDVLLQHRLIWQQK
jgi:hypothetical protein